MKKTGLAKDVSSKSLKELLDISGSLTLLGSTVVNATPKALIEGSCAILRGLSNPNGIFNEGSNVRFGTSEINTYTAYMQLSKTLYPTDEKSRWRSQNQG